MSNTHGDPDSWDFSGARDEYHAAQQPIQPRKATEFEPHERVFQGFVEHLKSHDDVVADFVKTDAGKKYLKAIYSRAIDAPDGTNYTTLEDCVYAALGSCEKAYQNSMQVGQFDLTLSAAQSYLLDPQFHPKLHDQMEAMLSALCYAAKEYYGSEAPHTQPPYSQREQEINEAWKQADDLKHSEFTKLFVHEGIDFLSRVIAEEYVHEKQLEHEECKKLLAQEQDPRATRLAPQVKRLAARFHEQFIRNAPETYALLQDMSGTEEKLVPENTAYALFIDLASGFANLAYKVRPKNPQQYAPDINNPEIVKYYKEQIGLLVEHFINHYVDDYMKSRVKAAYESEFNALVFGIQYTRTEDVDKRVFTHDGLAGVIENYMREHYLPSHYAISPGG